MPPNKKRKKKKLKIFQYNKDGRKIPIDSLSENDWPDTNLIIETKSADKTDKGEENIKKDEQIPYPLPFAVHVIEGSSLVLMVHGKVTEEILEPGDKIRIHHAF